MAKSEKYVVTPDRTTKKALSDMSTTMHSHLMDTALRAGHGHAVGRVAGNKAPDNDHALQRGSFVPQRVFAGPSQASQGSFQQGGPNGAEYQPTNVGSDCGDSDSTGPTGY